MSNNNVRFTYTVKVIKTNGTTAELRFFANDEDDAREQANTSDIYSIKSVTKNT